LKNDKILFVINPVAGGSAVNRKNLLSQIAENLPAGQLYDIKIWESLDQNAEIKALISDGGYARVVAVGGDGTINFVAQAAMKSHIPIGIIPFGSGNGLVRHLGIPLKTEEAIKIISAGREITIDTGLVNGNIFMCTTGAGFDALIGRLFSQSTKRGFFTYAKMTLQQLIHYKPREYTISFEGQVLKRKAFILAVANVNQYGNNTFIAPQADLCDGYLDICIIKPFKARHFPALGIRIFNKTITKSSKYEYYKARKIRIIIGDNEPVHFDGEPVDMGNILEIEVVPASLTVIVP
jgi:diacylglycerol kinase (ATP)